MRPTPEARTALALLGMAASGAGDVVFYDDFETGGGDYANIGNTATAIVFGNYAVRDIAKHVSRPITIDAGAAPTALVESSLNQAGVAAWELSWDGNTWVDGDAGTAIAAGATVIVRPNSIVAPQMRIRFTANVAPTAGTLRIQVSELRPLWQWASVQPGASGERSGFIRRAPEWAFAGRFALEMQTRQTGQAIGDMISAFRYFPIPYGKLLEYGVLITVPAVDWVFTPDTLDLTLDVTSRVSSPSFTMRVDGETGVVSYLNAGGVFVATSLGMSPGAGPWYDLRLGIDPLEGRYLYLEANGNRIGLAGSGKMSVTPPPPNVPTGVARIDITTRYAQTEGAVIDRAFVRVIS